MAKRARSSQSSSSSSSGVQKRAKTASRVYQKAPAATKELKFFDTSLSFTADATGEVPASGQLNLIPQGITQATRIGRLCTVKSIRIQANLAYIPGADTAGATMIYIYVVLDKQCNGAAVAVTVPLTGTDFRSALPNLANSQRFVILKRFAVPLVAQAGVQTAFGRAVSDIDWYMRCSLPIEFDATAADGSIATIRSNNLFLMAGTDNNTDDLVAVNGICRLRFSDD